jgi:hypothetical protein
MKDGARVASGWLIASLSVGWIIVLATGGAESRANQVLMTLIALIGAVNTLIPPRGGDRD